MQSYDPYELGYLAGIIDALGKLYVIQNNQTGKHDPILRIIGPRSKLQAIAERFPLFNGPYYWSKSQTYLTVRNVETLREVLIKVNGRLSIQKEAMEKFMSFVEFREKYRYSKEYPYLAELQHIARIRGVSK